MANNSAVAFSLLFSIVKYYKIQVKFEIGDNQQNFDQVMALFMPPPITMAGALSFTPVHPSTCTYGRNTLVRMSIRLSNDIRSLSRLLLIRILWNLVTLLSTMMSSSSSIMVYIAPPDRTMLSLVYIMALCLWKFTIWNDVSSLSRIFFVRILWNLVTLLSTTMSSSNSIMVCIAPCFQ